MQISFVPDWTMTRTAAKAEQELTNFKFEGPGWYFTRPGALLVVPISGDVEWSSSAPVEKTPWRQRWPAEAKFNFHYWSYDPSNSFNAIANAPTRRDER